MHYRFSFKIFKSDQAPKISLKPKECKEMIVLKQVHSNKVVWQAGVETEGDASFTNSEKVACCVLTADCLPIILYGGGKIASIHAGWRGLQAGIIEQTLTHFAGATHLKAVLGPAISAANYEVGEELFELFTKQDMRFAAAFKPSSGGKFLLDIKRLARIVLADYKVSNIMDFGLDTYANAFLPSYRRDNSEKKRLATIAWMQG